ncbi:MAG: hypothetical protein HZB38_07545 [Planctomycetes bacterium]|nr:hypothetical protein [Planctomycetota bacterium]
MDPQAVAPESPPPLQPRKRGTAYRVARLIVVIALMAWFYRFASERMDAVPASQTAGSRTAPPRSDPHVARIEAALAALNATLTKASGMSTNWQLQNHLVVSQELPWNDVQSRTDCADAIKLIADATVGADSDRLVSAIQDLPAGAIGLPADPDLPATMWMATTFGCGRWLAFRARARLATNGDLMSAVGDFSSALVESLREDAQEASAMFPNGEDAYWGSQVAASVVRELTLATVEHEFNRPAVRALEEFLQSRGFLSVRRTVAAYFPTPECDRQRLDRFYTLDSDGDGWLVVNRTERFWPGAPATAASPRNPLWNLGSPLFRGRRTIVQRIERIRAIVAGLDEVPPESFITIGESLARAQQGTSIDGPMGPYLQRINAAFFGDAVLRVARLRAELVMAALSAYRAEHGEYPPSLSALPPDYLENLPTDLLRNGPFVYELKSAERYDLVFDKRVLRRIGRESDPRFEGYIQRRSLKD